MGFTAIRTLCIESFSPAGIFYFAFYLFSSLPFHTAAMLFITMQKNDRNNNFFEKKKSKTPFSFPRSAFFIVYSYLITAVPAVPVIQTTTAATKISTDVKAEPQTSTILSEHSRVNDSDSEEENPKKVEFKSCSISNVTYQHKEQIPRSDPCEMCVCVDSEMYCFWKLCSYYNSTTSTPAPSVASTNKQETETQSNYDNNVISLTYNSTDEKLKEVAPSGDKFSKILTDQRKYNALKKLEVTSPKIMLTGEQTTTQASITSTEEPKVCYIMGRMYKYGEVLPRDTGTCLECSCSDGGKVTCSPKDCVSQPDLDYLSHNNNLDMFDIDTF